MKRLLVFPGLIAVLSSLVGFYVIRLISIKYQNDETASDYFQLLIQYSFYSSIFSSFLVYLNNDLVAAISAIRLRRKLRYFHSFLLLCVLLSTLYYFGVGFNKSILFISTLIFEFWASQNVLQGNYLRQQLIRVLPIFFVFFGLIFEFNVSPGNLFLLSFIGMSIFVSFFIKMDLNSVEIKAEQMTKITYPILLILLSAGVKYIPVLEAEKLMSISMFTLFIYSSKTTSFVKGIQEQIFGTNLLKTNFIESDNGKNIFPIFLFLVSGIVVLVMNDLFVDISVWILALDSNEDIGVISALISKLTYALPLTGVGMVMKNIAYNSSGIKPLIYVLFFEIIIAFFLYILYFNYLGVFSVVYFHIIAWLISVLIFAAYSDILTPFKVVLITLIIAYVSLVAVCILSV